MLIGLPSNREFFPPHKCISVCICLISNIISNIRPRIQVMCCLKICFGKWPSLQGGTEVEVGDKCVWDFRWRRKPVSLWISILSVQNLVFEALPDEPGPEQMSCPRIIPSHAFSIFWVALFVSVWHYARYLCMNYLIDVILSITL